MALTRSRGRCEAVNAMIGIETVRGAAFSCRATSHPSMSGNPRSSTITLGAPRARDQRLPPGRCWPHVEAEARQIEPCSPLALPNHHQRTAHGWKSSAWCSPGQRSTAELSALLTALTAPAPGSSVAGRGDDDLASIVRRRDAESRESDDL